MNDQRVLVASLLLVAAAVAGAVLAPSVLAGDGNSASDGQRYSYEDLADGGTTVDERYPSLRPAGTHLAFWTVRYPPSGLNTYGGQDANKEFLQPDSTVRRNKIRMYTARPWDGQTKTFTFKIVYWTEETKQVTEGNTTTTETVAEVEAVDTKQLEFGQGFGQYQDIQLRSHYDEPVRVTIWLKGHRDSVRWTFKHQSIATAQPVNIDSKSDLTRWLLFWNFIPSLVALGLVSRGVPKLRDAAGAGPDRAATVIGGGLLVTLGFMIWGYVELASLVAAVPLVFPFAVGWVAGAILLDQDEAVEHIGLLRLDTEAATSPIDAEAEVLDALEAEVEGYDVVQMPNGDLALYQDGFGPFWARLKGKYAKLDVHNQASEIEARGDYDRLFVIDQDAEDLIDHQPETVVMNWPWRTYDPETDDERLADVLPHDLGREQYIATAFYFGGLAAATWASQQWLGTWIWGAATCVPGSLVAFAEPVAGRGDIYCAPGQSRKAYATALYMEVTLRRFETIPQLLREVIDANKRELDVKEMLRQLDDESIIKNSNDPDANPLESRLVEDDPSVSDGDKSFRDQVGAGGDD